MATCIAGYELGPVLGRGGLATVYHGRHRQGGPGKAIKVLHEELAQEAAIVARFQEEGDLAGCIHHPRVVVCRESGESDGCYYQIYDHYPGGDAQDLLRHHGGRLELEQSLLLFRDIAEALSAVAAAGVVHRDVKPGNILLDAEERGHLCDFGLALRRGEHLHRTLPVGTLAYCSPEQLRGDSDLDQRSDIYSLGATLYRFCSGNLLYDDDDQQRVIAQVLSAPLPDMHMTMPQVPEAVRDLVLSCCAKEASRRPARVVDVLQYLGAILADLDIDPRTVAHHRPPPALAPQPHHGVSPAQRHAAGLLISIEDGGRVACVHLGAETRLTPALLELSMREAAVLRGRIEEAVNDCLRPAPFARRLILAESYVEAGVQSQALAPPQRLVRPSDDGLRLLIDLHQGQPVSAGQLQRELAWWAPQLRLEPRLWRALVEEGAPDCSQMVVASQREAQAGRSGSWQLRYSQLPCAVTKGETVAIWMPPTPSRPGRSFAGEPLPPPPQEECAPQDFCGVGLRQHSGDEGISLVAARSGYLWRHPQGTVQVEALHEVEGPVAGPLQGPRIGRHSGDAQLLLVRGDMVAGARLESEGDVLIVGNVIDAVVSVGGDCVVMGRISGTAASLHCGGGLWAQGLANARVAAAQVSLSGPIAYARVHSLGDIAAPSVVGGEVVAGGSIRVNCAGSWSAATTALRCACLPPQATLDRLLRLRGQYRQAQQQALSHWLRDLDEELQAIRDRSRRFSRPSAGPPPWAQVEILHRQVQGQLAELALPLAAPGVASKAHIVVRRLAHRAVLLGRAGDPYEELQEISRHYYWDGTAASLDDPRRSVPEAIPSDGRGRDR